MNQRLLIYSAIILLGGYIYLVTRPEPAESVVSTRQPKPTAIATPQTCFPINTTEIIHLTNLERSKQGLVLLVENPLLDKAAQLKANDMITSHYWGHYSPTGISPWYWINQAGYRYFDAGENLAETYANPAQVVTAWYNSPGHRANLLRPQFRETGIAVACGLTDKSTTVIVAEYASH